MFSMKAALVLALLPLASAYHNGFISDTPKTFNTFSNQTDPSTVCGLLKQKFSNLTFIPTDAGYQKENEVSWSPAAWLGPACIFAPRNAEDLSWAVKILVKHSTPFAMRGGGHMPITDAASINSTGVQISSTNLNTLKLSEDNQIMSIGPGPRWGDVWEHLDGSNLTVVGGRLPPVGVPGLLLGGGISYFSNAHGLASSNGKINAYECVLADGKIVEATKSGKYADLYWALLGGASNYCLVTRFDLRTFYAKTPIRAEAYYIASNTTKDAYLDALLTMTLEGDIDTAAAVIPVARWGPNYTVPSYEASLLYNGTTAPTSGPFAAFYDNSALKAEGNSSKLQPLSFARYSQVFRPAFQPGGGGYGFRQKFRVVPIKADREAMDIVHDTWLSALKESNVANRVPGFFAGLAYNCVTKTFAQQSQGMPQNVEPIPQLWVEEAMSWSNAADDAEVEALVSNFNAEIEKQLEAKNLAVRYIYLNDADKGQKAFESYGVENVLRLKAIREKYDPRKVFTNLMPGGFKIDRAEVEGY